MMVTPLPTKTEYIVIKRRVLEERILDRRLTAGNPAFSDAHRMAARARVEELEWVKSIKEVKDA